MNLPLVSVVCLIYNHERFVAEAIQSVLAQTYRPVQLIVVDDRSEDRSVEKVKKILAGHPEVEFIALPVNLGNCRAFNKGYERAKGEFVIDLSGDDTLMPERIEKGVNSFQYATKETGVNFGDAILIDEEGNQLGYHSDRFPHDSIPQGDVYCDVISRYFINSPTMMMRREVFEKLGGYDESLAYEDFDFWVRSARYFSYYYTPEPLVKRRIHGSSLGHRQYRRGSGQLESTLRVCEKAFKLNTAMHEHSALKKRIRYELKQALRLGEITIARDYWRLFRRIP